MDQKITPRFNKNYISFNKPRILHQSSKVTEIGGLTIEKITIQVNENDFMDFHDAFDSVGNKRIHSKVTEVGGPRIEKII